MQEEKSCWQVSNNVPPSSHNHFQPDSLLKGDEVGGVTAQIRLFFFTRGKAQNWNDVRSILIYWSNHDPISNILLSELSLCIMIEQKDGLHFLTISHSDKIPVHMFVHIHCGHAHHPYLGTIGSWREKGLALSMK